MKSTGALVALCLLSAGCSAVSSVNTGDTETDCSDLSSEAVRISADKNVQLLKVRDAAIVTDNRETYSTPTGSGESVVLLCRGKGVWSDGSNDDVRITETIDADGDNFIKYEALP